MLRHIPQRIRIVGSYRDVQAIQIPRRIEILDDGETFRVRMPLQNPEVKA